MTWTRRWLRREYVRQTIRAPAIASAAQQTETVAWLVAEGTEAQPGQRIVNLGAEIIEATKRCRIERLHVPQGGCVQPGDRLFTIRIQLEDGKHRSLVLKHEGGMGQCLWEEADDGNCWVDPHELEISPELARDIDRYSELTNLGFMAEIFEPRPGHQTLPETADSPEWRWPTPAEASEEERLSTDLVPRLRMELGSAYSIR